MILLLLLVFNFEQFQIISSDLDRIVNICILLFHIENFLLLVVTQLGECIFVLFVQPQLFIFNLLFLIEDLLLHLFFFFFEAFFNG